MRDEVKATRTAEVVRQCMQSVGGVGLGYLFGSVAAGREGPLSDIDVAVLPVAGVDSADLEDRLGDALCRALGAENIDLVMLDAAPAHLSYRVVRDGKLLVCADRAALQRFVTRTVMEYLDFKPVREAAFRTSRDAILRGA